MKMTVQKTARGFNLVEFLDLSGKPCSLHGKPCSLQESSLATEQAIWLGVDAGGGRNGRMHLSRAQVQELLPLLQHFVETGELPQTSPTRPG